MKYDLKPVEIELCCALTPSANLYALAHNTEGDEPDFIVIKDGKQVSRRPVSDYGFEVKYNWLSGPGVVVLANGIELFHVTDIMKYAFDGDIITNNHSRTVEEGIAEFDRVSLATLYTEGKITFILD